MDLKQKNLYNKHIFGEKLKKSIILNYYSLVNYI